METPASICKKKAVTSNQKWTISLFSALIFILLSLPFVYQLTNQLLAPMGIPTIDINGTPTLTGIIIHGVVYLLITRLVMGW